MCGIAGIVGAAADDLRPIAAMTAALRHRGPDTAADVADPRLGPSVPEGADVALGHRRLAIIDLTAAGHGPMASADGRLWITYNGEIFNYVELRAELARLGHRFRTASDTEVLLAAYAEWGADALHRFNGMWAFAI